MAESVRALASRTTPGATLLPGPPPGPVLVVAPHPDDEVIGPGGTVARHVLAGDHVRVLLATSGEGTAGGGGQPGVVREGESRAACRLLGVADVIAARLPDTRLADCVDDLATLIARHGADVATVYVPNALDPHPDHRAAHDAVLAAGLNAAVYGYEVWSPAPADVLMDVTAVWERKEEALRCFATALETVDYVRAARGLAAYRSAVGAMGGRGYAEAFQQILTA